MMEGLHYCVPGEVMVLDVGFIVADVCLVSRGSMRVVKVSVEG